MKLKWSQSFLSWSALQTHLIWKQQKNLTSYIIGMAKQHKLIYFLLFNLERNIFIQRLENINYFDDVINVATKKVFELMNIIGKALFRWDYNNSLMQINMIKPQFPNFLYLKDRWQLLDCWKILLRKFGLRFYVAILYSRSKLFLS